MKKILYKISKILLFTIIAPIVVPIYIPIEFVKRIIQIIKE